MRETFRITVERVNTKEPCVRGQRFEFVHSGILHIKGEMDDERYYTNIGKFVYDQLICKTNQA